MEESNAKRMQLEIKQEEEVLNAATKCKETNISDRSDDEELTHLEDMLVKNGSEDDQDTLDIDVAMDVDEADDDADEDDDDDEDDEDKKPLSALRKTRKDLKFSKALQSATEKEGESAEYEQKPKSRRGRRPKDASKENNKSDGKFEKTRRAAKKLTKDPNAEKPRNGLEKGRESDEFIAQWKPLLECDICNETFQAFDLLKGHFKNVHKTRCYIKCCERKFYRRCVLVDHIRLHINPETHKCDICGKPSSSKYNLKLHKRVVHEETEPFECEVCHRSFNQKPNLERHLLTHATGSKDFVCKECGKGYVLECQLKSHIKTVHSDDRVCDQCGKTLHGIGALKKHLMEHAGIERPKYPCDECGAQLRTRGNLRRHKAAYHNDGKTIYVCSICGKVAASEYGLLTHKKNVHQVERKHKCTYCDKAFKRPKFLREHIATHTGEDLYQCPHCPQTFKVSSNMHHHRKKAHPVEFEEGRKNRLQLRKVDITQVTNQVVI